MSIAPSNDFKELVRSRTDIVRLIGETVALQSQRGKFVGLCPFHDDHKPSMNVDPERQSFRCWACNTGGDCFEFVMQREKVGFREALEILAARAQLEVPKMKGGASGDQEDPLSKPRLYEALAWAESQFHECLVSSPLAAEARDYLGERGFTQETIRRFRLGYHPADWRWLLERSQGKYSVALLQKAGLVSERRDGNGYYDEFVERVMFSIRNGQGKTVAFGGRILPGHGDANLAKYKNSRESPVFEKSRLLYGLDHAREGIRKAGCVVVVEGYTDCIMAHQCGIENVVGTLGTALTEDHVTNLRRFIESGNVVLVYDGDQAGRNAAEKSIPRFLAQSVDLRILTLPDDLDPADAFLQHGKEWFAHLLTEAPEVWDYKFQCVIQRYGLGTIHGRQQVYEEMLQTLGQVPASVGNSVSGAWQVRENLMLGRLSHRLGIPLEDVRRGLADLRKGQARRAADAESKKPPQSSPSAAQVVLLMRSPTKDEKVECELLEILLSNPETVGEIRDCVPVSEIGNAVMRKLLEICYRLADAEAGLSYESLLSELDDPELKRLCTYLDEQARKKRIGPENLHHTLTYFRHRRELAPHVAFLEAAGRQAETANSGIDSKELLRRSSEMNSKRQRN